MADDEQFSLCWNNFNSNLSAGFHESLCRGDLVDVTLAAEGQFVKAHRLVLSDVSHAALKDLIQFMYCGEVNVKQDALPAFISTAESLQIKGLTDGDPGPVQSPVKSSTPAPQHSVCTNPILSVPRTKPTKSLSKYKIETDDSDEKGQPLVVATQTGIKRPTQRISLSQSNLGAKKIKGGETLEDITSPHVSLPDCGDGKPREEFIDMPIDIATKAEPDYDNDARETSEQEAYVEDDSYGDMKYDESYFTENDEAGTNAASNFKQSGSFSETYITESGGDQSTNETQVYRRRGRPVRKQQQKLLREEIRDALKTTPYPIVYQSATYGGMRIHFENNYYKHFYKNYDCTLWRCQKYEVTSCPAKIVVNNKKLFVIVREHNHSSLKVQTKHSSWSLYHPECSSGESGNKDVDLIGTTVKHLSLKEQIKRRLQGALHQSKN